VSSFVSEARERARVRPLRPSETHRLKRPNTTFATKGNPKIEQTEFDLCEPASKTKRGSETAERQIIKRANGASGFAASGMSDAP